MNWVGIIGIINFHNLKIDIYTEAVRDQSLSYPSISFRDNNIIHNTYMHIY